MIPIPAPEPIGPAPATEATHEVSQRPIVVYSLYRLGILLGSLAVVFLLGLRGWWWLLVSVVVAAAVSYLALPRQRREAAESLAARAAAHEASRQRREHTSDDDAAEDAVLDATPAPEAPAPGDVGPAGPADSAGDDADPAGRPAPPQREGEREPDHELEPADVPQDRDQPRT